MGCEQWQDALSAGLDGELDRAEDDALAAHLERCAGCRDLASRLEEQHRRHRLQPAAPIPDLTSAVLARTGAPPVPMRGGTGGRSRRWPLVAAVSVAAALLAGLLVNARSESPAPDIWLVSAAALPGARGEATEVTLQVRNQGGNDRLVGVASPAAQRAELHLVEERDGRRLMLPVSSLSIPGASGGGAADPHVMLIGLTEDLVAGTVVPVELRLARAGSVTVDAVVS